MLGKTSETTHFLLSTEVALVCTGWFLWECNPQVLNHVQESLYGASYLAGVTGHRSHLQVSDQTLSFFVVMGCIASGVMLPQENMEGKQARENWNEE